MSALQQFKVNGLVIPLRRSRDRFIFALNFNLPQNRLSSVEPLLATVRSCVQDEFPAEISATELYYRITASYTLTNHSTNVDRLWLGSFQPRTTQEHTVLSNRPYHPERFEAETADAISPERVIEKLELAGLDSDWSLSNLQSVILCFQARCNYSTHVFRPDSLVFPAARIHGARSRKPVSFERLLE